MVMRSARAKISMRGGIPRLPDAHRYPQELSLSEVSAETFGGHHAVQVVAGGGSRTRESPAADRGVDARGVAQSPRHLHATRSAQHSPSRGGRQAATLAFRRQSL